MNLVYLSPVAWSSFAQRPHKFVEWFHQKTNGEVLWIEPYPTRLPKISDLTRLKLNQSRECSNIPSWISLVNTKSLPVEPIKSLSWINQKIWAGLFNEIDKFCLNKECIFVFGKPSRLAVSVMDRYLKYPSLYDAMDDFPAFYDGISQKSMERVQRQLVSKVDTLWSSSTHLKDYWETYHPNVILVNNGFDEGKIFLKKNGIKPEKVFGYVGTVAGWFDWDWVAELAKLRPTDEVHIHGPIYGSVPFDLPKNIKFFDQCDHSEAVKKMSSFDVGLIPFKCNQLTLSVDPIKYYEYKAVGVPVVATNFGEMRLRDKEQGVFISKSKQDIQTIIESSLNYKKDELILKSFLSNNSWKSRFDSTRLF